MDGCSFLASPRSALDAYSIARSTSFHLVTFGFLELDGFHLSTCICYLASSVGHELALGPLG